MLEPSPPPSPSNSAASLPVFERTDSDVELTRISKAGHNDEVISIEGPQYPGQLALSFILVALLMAMFLVRDLQGILMQASTDRI